MPDLIIDPELKKKFLAPAFRPAVVTWNRLEGRPRREDFDRSLRVEIRDPLWMLCRQWQFGEFQAEDAGSAIKAKTQLTTARINRYAGGSGQAVAYDDNLPLETTVEREAIPFDLMTRAQMGRHWLRMLAAVGDYKALYLAQYGFSDPPSGSEVEAHLRSDRKAWQFFAAVKGRAVDGGKLLEAIRSETHEHENWLTGVVPDVTQRNKILQTAGELVEWFIRVYSQPGKNDDAAWADAYLEYQFACSAPADAAGATQTVLVAEQYHHGHLDWYSVDLNDSADAPLPDKAGVIIPPAKLVLETPISFVPNPITFAGMPKVRWWEFEDRKVDLGNIRPSTTDLATLMLAEFGLIYGNDWSLIPYDLDVGSIAAVLGVVVTDVFGVRTLIRPAVNLAGGEQQRWSIYHLSTTSGNVDPRLFLPPATPKMLESSPLERVILARDEMANMVWGIEHTIPDLISGGVSGHEAAIDLERYFTAIAGAPAVTPIPTTAQIRYRLGTRVQENWIPFIAVHNPGSNREIRLQRAAMPRLIPGIPKTPVEPRGAILRVGLEATPKQPYFVHEEEVPRAGAIVTRTFQRTRWQDGKIRTWLGRRKQTGRGQGASGLQFDFIAPV